MSGHLASWRGRLRNAIRHKLSRLSPDMSAPQLDDETERRFYLLMQMQVPSDAELREMQARGELGSDAALARSYP
jgi:hypothetical protein